MLQTFIHDVFLPEQLPYGVLKMQHAHWCKKGNPVKHVQLSAQSMYASQSRNVVTTCQDAQLGQLAEAPLLIEPGALGLAERLVVGL